MAGTGFTEDEKAIITRKIQQYFKQELEQDIGRFDAEALLEFFSKDIGAYFYNRGLYDAQTALSRKMDDLNELIYQLERPTELRK